MDPPHYPTSHQPEGHQKSLHPSSRAPTEALAFAERPLLPPHHLQQQLPSIKDSIFGGSQHLSSSHAQAISRPPMEHAQLSQIPALIVPSSTEPRPTYPMQTRPPPTSSFPSFPARRWFFPASTMFDKNNIRVVSPNSIPQSYASNTPRKSHGLDSFPSSAETFQPPPIMQATDHQSPSRIVFPPVQSFDERPSSQSQDQYPKRGTQINLHQLRHKNLKRPAQREFVNYTARHFRAHGEHFRGQKRYATIGHDSNSTNAGATCDELPALAALNRYNEERARLGELPIASSSQVCNIQNTLAAKPSFDQTKSMLQSQNWKLSPAQLSSLPQVTIISDQKLMNIIIAERLEHTSNSGSSAKTSFTNTDSQSLGPKPTVTWPPSQTNILELPQTLLRSTPFSGAIEVGTSLLPLEDSSRHSSPPNKLSAAPVAPDVSTPLACEQQNKDVSDVIELNKKIKMLKEDNVALKRRFLVHRVRPVSQSVDKTRQYEERIEELQVLVKDQEKALTEKSEELMAKTNNPREAINPPPDPDMAPPASALGKKAIAADTNYIFGESTDSDNNEHVQKLGIDGKVERRHSDSRRDPQTQNPSTKKFSIAAKLRENHTRGYTRRKKRHTNTYGRMVIRKNSLEGDEILGETRATSRHIKELTDSVSHNRESLRKDLEFLDGYGTQSEDDCLSRGRREMSTED